MNNINFKVVFIKKGDMAERTFIDLNGNDLLEVFGKNFAEEKDIGLIVEILGEIAVKKLEEMANNDGKMSIWVYRYQEGSILKTVEPDIHDILDNFFVLNLIEKDSEKEEYFKLTDNGLKKFKELKSNR